MQGDDTSASMVRPKAGVGSEPILLYDGVCGFCDRTVQFVLARDADGPMRFATLEGEVAARILRDRPDLADVDSLLLVEPSNSGPPRVRARSDAALAVAGYVGGGWAVLAAMGRLVPRPIRDAAYDFFARHRYRWFGRYDACPLPLPEVRRRFLD